ncbi:MAG: shikimate dehydrogenase [Sphingosinicella sp.]|nr:shikimate dehydrogenase [Sphingosinicella sp.]
MGHPYAEVIGDPISHSKSPLIHGFWLEKLGLEGEYRATRVEGASLRSYLETKRNDIWWRGCNVTAPLKEKAAEQVGAPSGLCQFLGAVNCITRTPLSCLVGANSDLAGLKEALSDVELKGAHAVLIGAGGAARAALCHLVSNQVRQVTILARNEARASALASLIPPSAGTKMEAATFDRFPGARQGVDLLINATPMGMRGGPSMHPALIDWLATGGREETCAFDMVYDPIETEFLAAALAGGARIKDGLHMLIGQAAPAFELFFGAAAPREHDVELRALVTR